MKIKTNSNFNLIKNIKTANMSIFFIIFTLIANLALCSENILILPVKGVIDLGLSTFIKNSLKEAEEEGIDTVILEMDTPGGRVDAANIICEALLDYKGSSITFVLNQAWSAGSMIALATDKIIMRPASSIGSAEPREGISGEKADEKIVSALRSRFKALAEEKNHNTALAQAMVDKDIAVFKVALNDTTSIITSKELDEKVATGEDNIKILATISKEGKLLNLTAQEAEGYSLAEAIVKDKETLLEYLEIDSPTIIERVPSWSENMVRFITHPILSSLLLGLGFWAIIFALRIPGLGLPEIVGVTALGLFFWGHRLAGLSEWIDIFLVIVGIALILIELFIIPGFGITGALGIISLLSGIILTLISHPIYPPFESFNRAAGLIISSFLFGSILLFISFKFLPKSKAWEKIVLRSTISREKIVQENLEAREGIALSDLRPSGRGRFNGKIYDVETMGDYIKKGEKIQIISKHGSIIKVRKV